MLATEAIGGIEMEMVRVVKPFMSKSRDSGSENSQGSLRILSLLYGKGLLSHSNGIVSRKVEKKFYH